MTTESKAASAHVSLRAAQHGRVSIPTPLGLIVATSEGSGWLIRRKPAPISTKNALMMIELVLLRVPRIGDDGAVTWSGRVPV